MFVLRSDWIPDGERAHSKAKALLKEYRKMDLLYKERKLCGLRSAFCIPTEFTALELPYVNETPPRRFPNDGPCTFKGALLWRSSLPKWRF